VGYLHPPTPSEPQSKMAKNYGTVGQWASRFQRSHGSTIADEMIERKNILAQKTKELSVRRYNFSGPTKKKEILASAGSDDLRRWL